MAELRGRLRPGGPLPGGPDLDRAAHTLPLASERSGTEQMIQTRCVLADLATVFGTASSFASTPPKTFADELEDASKALARARRGCGTTTPGDAWDRVAEIIYSWDAAFQDVLAGQSIDHGRAYELGRALAETYWALDPDAPVSKDDGAPPPNTWEFLFGGERVQVIDERARSLAPHFHPVTTPVVSATVHAWAAAVGRGKLRKPKTASGATNSLRQQVSYWHELVVAGVDPETLLKPYASLRFTKITPRVLRSFATEAAIGTVGLAGLVGLAVLSVEVQGVPGWKTLAGVAGALGVTIGGVQAALKNGAQSLLRRLRADVYTDLVTAETTSLPPLGRWTKRAVQREVRKRRVTAPLPAR